MLIGFKKKKKKGKKAERQISSFIKNRFNELNVIFFKIILQLRRANSFKTITSTSSKRGALNRTSTPSRTRFYDIREGIRGRETDEGKKKNLDFSKISRRDDRRDLLGGAISGKTATNLGD